MASRPELVECCKELGIDSKGMTIDEMMKAVRMVADERFGDKPYKISADELSDTLKHFLLVEYDYKIFDKDGKEVKF